MVAINNSINNGQINPAFMMTLNSNDNAKTGAGGIFQLGNSTNLTIIFDNLGNCSSSGIFTAPKDGFYFLSCALQFVGLSIASGLLVSIITTSKTYCNTISRNALSLTLGHTISCVAFLAKNETARVTGVITGELTNIANALGSITTPSCFFSGFYI